MSKLHHQYLRLLLAPLEAIQDIRATFSKLSADFSLPPSLDFSDDEVRRTRVHTHKRTHKGLRTCA
jgi:hypothetical protein